MIDFDSRSDQRFVLVAKPVDLAPLSRRRWPLRDAWSSSNVIRQHDRLAGDHELLPVVRNGLDFSADAGCDLNLLCDEAVAGMGCSDPDDHSDGEFCVVESARRSLRQDLVRQLDFETVDAQAIDVRHGSEDSGATDATVRIIAGRVRSVRPSLVDARSTNAALVSGIGKFVVWRDGRASFGRE
jgi:hypothetical protein